MDTIEEILYGRVTEFTASEDVEEGEPVKAGEQIGIARQKTAAGTRGEMTLCGPFVFKCAADLEFHETDRVSWDPKSKAVCPAETPGSCILGTASVDCKRGDGLVIVQVNG